MPRYLRQRRSWINCHALYSKKAVSTGLFVYNSCAHRVLAPLLDKDCAVCKDQFKLDTEDTDELVIVTLPCHHSFHEPCIMPWLKSSGTCPVCRYVCATSSIDGNTANILINRYQLIPQHESEGHGTASNHPAQPTPGPAPGPSTRSRTTMTDSPSSRPTSPPRRHSNSPTSSSSHPRPQPRTPQTRATFDGDFSPRTHDSLFNAFSFGRGPRSPSSPPGRSSRREPGETYVGSERARAQRRSSRGSPSGPGTDSGSSPDHVPGGWDSVD